MIRREFMQSSGTALLGAVVAQTVLGDDLPNQAVNDWIDRLKESGVLLGKGSISSLQWQEITDQIYRDVPLNGFQNYLDFETLKKNILEKIPEDKQEYFHRIDLDTNRGLTGKEPFRTLITKVAHVKKGEHVPPHGHSNMVSAFLVLSGQFEVSLYDKLHDSEDRMVVRRTFHSESSGAGTWSSISDYRDNVHWLKAKTDDCFFLSCKMLSIEKNRKLNGRIHINLRDSKTIGSNTYQASKITYEEATELY